MRKFVFTSLALALALAFVLVPSAFAGGYHGGYRSGCCYIDGDGYSRGHGGYYGGYRGGHGGDRSGVGIGLAIGVLIGQATRPYVYPQPVYVSPPVVYVPYAPPTCISVVNGSITQYFCN